jgi:two-component system C4-dicarboxylate transport sensor histidine kinase DctB
VTPADSEQVIRERLVEAARLATLGRLVPSFLHQMSTPLAAISLRAESLEASFVAPDPPRDRMLRYLRAMNDETRRCQDLLAALREFTGRDERSPGPVELEPVCRRAAQLVHDEAMRRQAQLILDLAAGLVVTGWRGRLGQAVLALLLNAVDASPRSGRVTLQTRVDGPDALIGVMDEGEGVPESVRAQLFTPFATSRPPDLGLGLGLMASRWVAESHGGRIEFDCFKGGSSFVMRIPIVRSSSGDPNDDGAAA